MVLRVNYEIGIGIFLLLKMNNGHIMGFEYFNRFYHFTE